MDRIQTLILNAFTYENENLPPVKNDKQPTWWPHMVRDYSLENQWSDEPDSIPIDLENQTKMGNIEVYNFIMDKVINKLLTPDEIIIIRTFCNRGFLLTASKAGKILKLNPQEARHKYERILIKIKNNFSKYEINSYLDLVI